MPLNYIYSVLALRKHWQTPLLRSHTPGCRIGHGGSPPRTTPGGPGKVPLRGHHRSQILNLTSRSAHETRELRSIKAPPSQLFPSQKFACHLCGRRSFDRCSREFLKRPTLTATRAHFFAHGDRGLVVASIARGPICRFLMDFRPCNRRLYIAQTVAGRYSI